MKRESIDVSLAPLYSVALGNVHGKNVTTFLLEYAPGESVPPHRHSSSHASNPSKDKKAKLLAVLIHDADDVEMFKVD